MEVFWRPVKLELPPANCRLLLFLTEEARNDYWLAYAVEIGVYIPHEDGTGHWNTSDVMPLSYVSHWSYLPELPYVHDSTEEEILVL